MLFNDKIFLLYDKMQILAKRYQDLFFLQIIDFILKSSYFMYTI